MRYRRLTYGYALVVSPTVAPQAAWRPPSDVYETPRSITVTVELPGIEPDEVDLLLFENALVVEGRRTLPSLEEGGIFDAAEIRRGPFRLEIALPSRVEPEPVELRCELGLLFITLSKVEVGGGR
jgi:HSP20 family protein